MKYLSILLILTACHMNKENTQNTDLNRIHDIWALDALQGELYAPGTAQKHPTLEIYASEKRVTGNDGCNQLMGEIKTLTEKELRFGMLAGTKMMCQNMEVPDQFGRLLTEVQTYKIDELKLYLYNESGTELLVLKKVD